MYFLSSRTKAQFYNGSKITFFVRKDSVDIIFKIGSGVYLTVNVYTLSKGRLLLACSWDNFFNRLQNVENIEPILNKLKVKCPFTYKALKSKDKIHFAYTEKTREKGVIMVEMKAPNDMNNIADFIHESVISKAIELMSFNLKMQEEIEEHCPFSTWKFDLLQIREINK